MRLHAILAAAENVQATDRLPYYLSLLAVVLSLIALIRASASGKNQPPAPGAPAPQPEAIAPKASPVVVSPPVAATTSGTQSNPAEIVAVIAAAVAATIGNNHRIVSIKPMSTSWERAGRQSVLTSHRIR